MRDGNLYVGCTSDLEKRLKRHQTGQVLATKSRRPFKLVYFEKIQIKKDAFQKERYLKSLYGYKLKRRLIKEFNKEIDIG